MENQNFYIAARETGSMRDDLPLWASAVENPMALAEATARQVTREDVSSVPGAFQLHNVLSTEECAQIIQAAETLGFTDDAAVSLPRSIRHNNNLTWVADDTTLDIIWQRSKGLFSDNSGHFGGKQPLGLNGRCRFYRYQQGDFFSTHTDGSWPGSRIVDGQVISNAYDDRWSMYTYLIFLSDEYQGGHTQFLVNSENPDLPARGRATSKTVNVRTPAGSVLCFPHGTHPLHCLHSSEDIVSGTKYIIRTDVLFEL
jgi:predicted 2-oxoglutarate/Fe(II)-dependent dioxygenase YbiX